jgi:hypothetical protein
MFYVIDAKNCVVDVDSDWDSSLSSNGGAAHAARSQLLGRPLDQFLAGDATKMFVRAALDAARLFGQTRVLPYRCDSPTERRQFEMVISPMSGGHVKVEHRLLSSQARPASRSASQSASRSESGALPAAGWRCSQCLAVRHAGSLHWTSADVAAAGAPLAQDVCPSCASRLFTKDVS